MPKWAWRLMFLLVVVGGGILIGFATSPGPWYDGLQKPPFNPPPWLFGPVWTLIYIFVAVTGWRVWEAARARNLMTLWLAQLLLNFSWSPVFFGLHMIAAALAIILALIATILVFIVLAWQRDRIAAWLFVPYLAWVSFATVLNAALFQLN